MVSGQSSSLTMRARDLASVGRGTGYAVGEASSSAWMLICTWSRPAAFSSLPAWTRGQGRS